jgi:hypothetical protein
MNTICRKPVLNEAFKRFQQLPTWPIAEPRTPGATQLVQAKEDSDEQGGRAGELADNAIVNRRYSPNLCRFSTQCRGSS